MSRFNFRFPLTKPDWLKDLASAEAEAELGENRIAAVKALHWSIQAYSIVLMALPLGVLFIVGTQNGLEIGTIVNSIKSLTRYEALGILILFIGWAVFVTGLAEFHSRLIVQVLGFVISIDPGSIIRNYTYGYGVKTYLLIVVLPFLAAQFALIYFSMQSALRFLAPRFAIVIPTWALIALVVAWLGAGIVLPAFRTKVQEDEELLEALLLTRLVKSDKLMWSVRSQVVDYARAHLGVQMVKQIREKGPDALADWLIAGPEETERIATQVGLASSYRKQLVRMRTGNLSDGRQLHALETRESGRSRITIIDPQDPGSLPEAMRENEDGSTT